MTTLADRVRRTRTRLTPETLRAAQDLVARVTGLRLDLRRLDAAEQGRFVELVDAARPPGRGGLNIGLLNGRQTRDLDGLLEAAAALEPGTRKRQREQTAAAAKVEQLARRARRLPVSQEEEQGLLRAIWAQASKDRALHIGHIGTLTFLLAAFATGETLAAQSRFDLDADGERVLIFHAHYGLYGHAGGEGVDAMKTLKHLEANAWLSLTRRGTSVEVRLGSRAKRVLHEGAK